MPQNFTKDPQAVLDYQFDWSNWLGSDTISTATVTADGLTKASQSNTTTAVTVWLSGGQAGNDYAVVCRIVTNGGRTDERTIFIQCRDR